jgi:glycosyltransferase involved in cell wall biosynthesis
MPARRIPIGMWSELPLGAKWANEGVARVVGFLVEGAAASKAYTFHLVVRRGLAAQIRDDLRTLAATEGADWLVHEPTAEQEAHWERQSERELAKLPVEERRHHRVPNIALALYANAQVAVDGWLVTFPYFNASLFLDGSKAVLMPDAIPYEVPLGWQESWGASGYWPQWREIASSTCRAADAVITFSKHVAERNCVELLGVDREKIHVVPLAGPDLIRELPFVRGRRKTPESRAQAAAILREHAVIRGLSYLHNFPFEQCTFLAAATQDRPTKNLGLAAEAMARMISRDRESMKLFVTAPLLFGVSWTRLPTILEQRQVHRDVVSMHNLPRQVHAALFHAASLTVHSSFYEGIIGCLPLYESVSVGTPCLFARGPHTDELLEAEPEFAPFAFDPNDAEGLVALIRRTLNDRHAALEIQARLCAKLRKWTWSDVADGYVTAVLAGNRRIAA